MVVFTNMIEGIRNRGCTDCKLHQTAEVVCEMGIGPKDADVVVVSKMPNSRKFQQDLEIQLEDLGLDSSRIYFTQAIKCRTFDQDASNKDIKICRQYLDKEIDALKPKQILALGNEALLSTTGHSGITKYRGRLIDRSSVTVIPTVSPSAVQRNPGQRAGFIADLRLFVNNVMGVESGIDPPKYSVIDTKKKLSQLKKALAMCEYFHFDVETHSEEWRPDGRIVSLSATCILDTDRGKKLFVFALPLYHPESPWRKTWRSVLKYLAPEMAAIPRVDAHNGKYDVKWMRRFGVEIVQTFDTMLAIHLINENIQKGLKPTAGARLGVPPWGIDTKNLLDKPLDEILEYNVLDTWYMYHIYLQLRKELKAKPRLLRLLKFLMMPASNDLVDSELRGVWLDLERLHERKPIAVARLAEIEEKISEYLPDPESDDWPSDARGRPRAINYNPSIFAKWFLFDWLGLPILDRGKDKQDGSPGDPSMRESVLLELRDEHPAVQLMLDRVQWQKAISSFFNAYEELYDDDHRIHTNFKLAGTVTGRLSSGKADQDKISGVRGKQRGVNLQQVPRDPFIRGLFGAPPGWSFVEADYSQVELRVVAFLSRDSTMLHLYQTGADIHTTTAASVLGIPFSQVTKDDRKKAKAVNFGFVYGMGWRKFIATAFEKYDAVFTEDEAKAVRKAFFAQFGGLLPWHARQRRLVNEFGRVQSPIGRVRHLPDIFSPEEGVRAEAERQAINSPVQSFASDMAVLAMIEVNKKIKAERIPANVLGLVHDAINFECRNDAVADLLPLVKDTMEDVEPLRKKFGVHLDIPILADLKVGQHWGDAKELSESQVYAWNTA